MSLDLPASGGVPSKLYIITRADLPLGVQGSQLAHAGIDLAFARPDGAERWHTRSNTLVLLVVRDEAALIDLLAEVPDALAFREPDRDDELTSIATIDPPRRLVRHLPLAFSPRALAMMPAALRLAA